MKTPSIDRRPTAISEVTELHLTFCVVSNTPTVSDIGDKEFAHLVFLHSYCFYGFDIIEDDKMQIDVVTKDNTWVGLVLGSNMMAGFPNSDS